MNDAIATPFALSFIVSLVSLLLALAAGIAWLRQQGRLQQLKQELAAHASRLPLLEAQLSGISEAQKAKEVALAQASEAQSRAASLAEQRQEALAERDAALRGRESAEQLSRQAERQAALLQQEMQQLQSRMQDWEQMKERQLQAAQAAVMKTGADLSSKLLEDHKRETEAARKESEALAQKTTASLTQEFTQIVTSVATLHQQVQTSSGMMDKVWKALTIPSEAGRFAEVGLENCLKQFGLEAGRDYVLQSTLNSSETGIKRPDALLFLPGDMVMVIDSKATNYLLELAEQEDAMKSEMARQEFKKRMAAHLRSLASKDYKTALLAEYRNAGKEQAIRRVINVMYLPTESALAHLRQSDPAFEQKCLEHEIIAAGPTGLSGLIALSRINIDMVRQAENQEQIIAAVQELLERVGVMLSYAGSVGKNLRQAVDQFSQFARSVNRRVLPSTQKLMKLGVRPAKAKDIPSPLPTFSVLDDHQTIEAEVESEPNLQLVQTEA